MQNKTQLLAQKLISDQLLRDLASGDPMRALGEISARDQAILCMALPEICSELLEYRQTEHAAQTEPKTSPMRP